MLLWFAVPSRAAGGKTVPPSLLWECEFHSVLPLGSEMFRLEGLKDPVMLLATAVSPELDGWKRVNQGGSRFVFAADGSQVQTYPRQVQFRVSASAMGRAPAGYELLVVKSPTPLNDFLLDLRFRLKIFHGLHAREVEPAHVHMVGVPADVPYNERIYRLTFELPPVPVQDRMVLEVLSPQGERVARFHFELM